MQRGEHLARVIGLAVIGGAVATTPAVPAAAEDPPEYLGGTLIGTPQDDMGYGITHSRSIGYGVAICGWMNVESFSGDAFVANYPFHLTFPFWSQQFGTTLNDVGRAIADYDGTYIAGLTHGSLAAGTGNAFLAKFDDHGSQVWWRELATPGIDSAHGIAVRGAIYICGETSGDLFGPNTGSIDSFVARYDTAGNLLWGRQFGTSSADFTCDVVVNRDGDVIIGGHRDGSAFLAKYNSSGTQQWVRSIDTPTEDRIHAIGVDYFSGDIYLAGDAYFPSGEQYAALLMKADSEGMLRWSREYDRPDPTDERWSGIDLDGEGSAFVCGGYRPSFGLEGSDVMEMAKYDSAGNQLWLLTNPIDAGESWASSIIAGDYLYISGYADQLSGTPGAGGLDAFVALFRSPDACYVDCDASGALDFFDFLCFMTFFDVGSAYADCDGNDAIDFFDFLCFQNAFAAGCP